MSATDSQQILARASKGRPRADQISGGRHGLTPEQVTASQRERLLRAMTDVVGEMGYVDARVEDVVVRAGVSRKTFYEIFGGKEECLLAVYDQATEQLVAIVSEARELPGTPFERIGRVLETVLEWAAEDPNLARLCLLETPAAGAAGRQREAAAFSWIVDVTTDTLSSLKVGRLPVELLVGGIQHLVVRKVKAGQTTSLPELAPKLTGIFRALNP